MLYDIGPRDAWRGFTNLLPTSYHQSYIKNKPSLMLAAKARANPSGVQSKSSVSSQPFMLGWN